MVATFAFNELNMQKVYLLAKNGLSPIFEKYSLVVTPFTNSSSDSMTDKIFVKTIFKMDYGIGHILIGQKFLWDKNFII